MRFYLSGYRQHPSTVMAGAQVASSASSRVDGASADPSVGVASSRRSRKRQPKDEKPKKDKRRKKDKRGSNSEAGERQDGEGAQASQLVDPLDRDARPVVTEIPSLEDFLLPGGARS